MTTSVSLRPVVSNLAPSMQNNQAKNLKIALCELNEVSREKRMNALSFMSNKLNLESKINETKVAPVEFVEDVKPTQSFKGIEKSSNVTAPSLESTIKNFQKGKTLSRVDNDAKLTSQMNYIAMNNRVLHGLV